MTSVLSIIGIIIGIALLVFLCYKGHEPIFVAMIASAVILALGRLSLIDGLTGTFPTGTANMLRVILTQFLASMMFGHIMERSGCAYSIAYAISDHTNSEWAPSIVLLISAVLGIGGMAMSAYLVVLPIATVLFSKSNYDRNLSLACIVGGSGTFANCFPGSPSGQNNVIVRLLHVDPACGLGPGIVAGLLIFLFNIIYVTWQGKRWRKQGRVFIDHNKIPEENEEFKKTLPHPVIALLPVILVLVLYNALKVDITFSLLAGIALCILIRLKAFSAKEWFGHCEDGFKRAFVPTLQIAAMSGLGAVVALTPAYQTLIGAIQKSTINPYLLCFLGANLMAGACGSGQGGLAALIPSITELLESYAAAGYSMGNMARMMVVGCMGLDTLPNNGFLIGSMSVCETSFKKAYRPIFMVTVLSPIVAGLIAIPFCSLF